MFKLLVLILSILVTACTSTDLPTWYIENVNNNQVMISGVGQGRTLSEAKKNAIEQISSQIWINVKSVSRQTDSYVSDGDSEYNDNRFYNQIDTNTANIAFAGVEYNQIEKINGFYYVQASVERSEIVRQLKNDIEDINISANEIIKQLGIQDELVWLFDNYSFINKRNKVISKVNILRSMRYNKDININNVNVVYKKIKNINSNLVVRIDTKNNEISRAIITKLMSDNIRGYSSKLSSYTNVLSIKIKNKNKKIGDIYITTLFISLVVKDKNGHLLMAHDLTSSGNSISNYKIAYLSAVHDFVNKIKNMNVLVMLGYESDK
ncbi:LPP20 family lipoprotein [Photobacterium toruni]|uniref:LPP20 family lipoprotein n=1 Tax=Photobacterium toruni TaxID=1935446 RepID=UPI0021103AF9|nr:LPP20 family lipoprotein [Photobacterium toruni]